MKFKRTVISFVASILVASTSLASVASAENVDTTNDVIVVLPETVDNTISADFGECEFSEINSDGVAVPYASKEPKELWDWSNGIYGIHHDEENGGTFYPLYKGSTTKTYYKFDTDTGKLTVDIEFLPCYNYTLERECTIKMYRAKKGFWENLFGTNWEYFSFAKMRFQPDEWDDTKVFSYSVPFTNLSSDYEYYFEFCNTSMGAVSSDSYLAFAGDFTISK